MEPQRLFCFPDAKPVCSKSLQSLVHLLCEEAERTQHSATIESPACTHHKCMQCFFLKVFWQWQWLSICWIEMQQKTMEKWDSDQMPTIPRRSAYVLHSPAQGWHWHKSRWMCNSCRPLHMKSMCMRFRPSRLEKGLQPASQKLIIFSASRQFFFGGVQILVPTFIDFWVSKFNSLFGFRFIVSLVVKCSGCLIFMCLYFYCSSVVFLGNPQRTWNQPRQSIYIVCWSFLATCNLWLWRCTLLTCDVWFQIYWLKDQHKNCVYQIIGWICLKHIACF